ncbi:snapalysin family zinc-dependent metalloprotease [Micromonospora zhanjiangensis]|uniref:Extracellular small neutral protease n=1 Tax=Micromonospora zhanjiangensis TaxID=1522057 RepID=A0ABV8KRM9_9ACTN
MSRRLLSRALGILALAAFGATAVGAGPAVAAPGGSLAIRNVCYTTSQAGPYAGTADQAASIWNNATANINMAKCGSNVSIRYTTGGGSYAVRYSLGNGYVVIDTQQAAQYSPLRIMTHELGHILGLPDNYNGNCAILMSGGSAGTSCTNPYPSSGEAAQVDRNFGSALSATSSAADGATVFQDSWPAPAGALR